MAKNKEKTLAPDEVVLNKLTPEGGQFVTTKKHAEKLLKLEESMGVKNYEYPAQNGDTE